MIARWQLVELGFTESAIRHRLDSGRLRVVYPGVYAVGQQPLTQLGRWMAAVLRCGAGAALSHSSAAAMWRIRPVVRGTIEVSVPGSRSCKEHGLLVHRRTHLDVVERQRIPVTTPAATLIDMAARLDEDHLEAAINEADHQDLLSPSALLDAVEQAGRRPGTAPLRRLLEKQTFTATTTALERQFRRTVKAAGLPPPLGQAWVNGYQVDFYWPDLGVVVEADSGRFHRTGSKQTIDRERDHAHFVDGLTPLRFTHWQIFHAPAHVGSVLLAAVSA